MQCKQNLPHKNEEKQTNKQTKTFTCRDPYQPNDNEHGKQPNERNTLELVSTPNACIERTCGITDKLTVAIRRR